MRSIDQHRRAPAAACGTSTPAGRPRAGSTMSMSTPSSSRIRASTASTLARRVRAPSAISGCHDSPRMRHPSSRYRRSTSRALRRSSTSSGDDGVRAPSGCEQDAVAPDDQRAGSRGRTADAARTRRVSTLREALRSTSAARARADSGTARRDRRRRDRFASCALQLLRRQQPAVSGDHARDRVDLRVLDRRSASADAAHRQPVPPGRRRSTGARDLRDA